MLECFVSDTKAKVKWFKNGQPVEVSVKTIIKYTILVKIHNTTLHNITQTVLAKIFINIFSQTKPSICISWHAFLTRRSVYCEFIF